MAKRDFRLGIFRYAIPNRYLKKNWPTNLVSRMYSREKKMRSEEKE